MCWIGRQTTSHSDNHFIIDRHPDQSGLVYAAGFSGQAGGAMLEILRGPQQSAWDSLRADRRAAQCRALLLG